MEEENQTPPVEKGQQLTLKCLSIGKEGDGIFKYNKFVIIVPETEKGKRYLIEVTAVSARVSFGKVIREVEE